MVSVHWLLVIQVDADVLAFDVDRSRQLRRVLALVVEVVDKDSVDAADDQLIILVVENREVDESDAGHVDHLHHVEVFVDEEHPKVSRYDKVQAVLVRKRDRGDRRVRPGHLSYLYAFLLFAGVPVPEVHLLLVVRHVDLVVQVFAEPVDFVRVVGVTDEFLHAVDQRLLVEAIVFHGLLPLLLDAHSLGLVNVVERVPDELLLVAWKLLQLADVGRVGDGVGLESS